MRSEILCAQVTLSCPPKQGCIGQIMHCRENKLYQLSSALRYLRKVLLDLKNLLLIFYSCITPFFPERPCGVRRQPLRTRKMWLIWGWEVRAPGQERGITWWEEENLHLQSSKRQTPQNGPDQGTLTPSPCLESSRERWTPLSAAISRCDIARKKSTIYRLLFPSTSFLAAVSFASPQAAAPSQVPGVRQSILEGRGASSHRSKTPSSHWSKLVARWPSTELHLHGQTGSSCSPKGRSPVFSLAGCKHLSAKH